MDLAGRVIMMPRDWYATEHIDLSGKAYGKQKEE